MTLTAADIAERYGPRALAYIGMTIHLEPALKDGNVISVAGQLHVGTHPWTQVDIDRETARRIVRTGLADILEWLGERPGPTPDQPYPAIGGRQLLNLIGERAQHTPLTRYLQHNQDR